MRYVPTVLLVLIGQASAEPVVNPESGLDILTEPPGAHVALDGQPIGKAPLRIRSLLTGEHTVEVSGLDGYAPASRTFTVEVGKSQTIKVRLEPTGPTTRKRTVYETETKDQDEAGWFMRDGDRFIGERRISAVAKTPGLSAGVRVTSLIAMEGRQLALAERTMFLGFMAPEGAMPRHCSELRFIVDGRPVATPFKGFFEDNPEAVPVEQVHVEIAVPLFRSTFGRASRIEGRVCGREFEIPPGGIRHLRSFAEGLASELPAPMTRAQKREAKRRLEYVQGLNALARQRDVGMYWAAPMQDAAVLVLASDMCGRKVSDTEMANGLLAYFIEGNLRDELRRLGFVVVLCTGGEAPEIVRLNE